jgi:PAS domain-containing protein
MIIPSAVERATRRRTQEIFANLRHEVFVETDRVFAVLMTLQWLSGIAAAVWISPNTWAGPSRSTHVHVWAAIFLGGAITALPVFLAMFQPGRTLTRYTIAIGQMATSSLLIHLTGGRIETHFHVFGSLAFLAFYRDWRLLVPATVVVVGDHLIRGLVWPESIYGVLSASIWRTVEHTGWVVFEDVMLAFLCVRGTREQWRVAERTAEFETSQDRYRAVVDQSAEGILVFDAERRTILEQNPAFLRLAGIGNHEVGRLAVDDSLLAGDVPLDDTIAQLLRDRSR